MISNRTQAETDSLPTDPITAYLVALNAENERRFRASIRRQIVWFVAYVLGLAAVVLLCWLGLVYDFAKHIPLILGGSAFVVGAGANVALWIRERLRGSCRQAKG